MAQPVFVSAVFYKDPSAALKWLEVAFGFQLETLITDAEGKVAHSQMTLADGALSIAGEWDGPIGGPARMRSPDTLDGINTQIIRVHLAAGLDAHCERARAAGARIVAEPEDQFYGARIYRCLDPEGHLWNFSQEVRVVSAEEMERESGLKIVTGAEAAS
jgi:uncharacterized glyoxalase superfamily protein PhnB